MDKSFSFADSIVNRAISLALPAEEIEGIIQILQKYPVDCFDIEAGAAAAFPAIRELAGDTLRRSVCPQTEKPTEWEAFRKIRINWKDEKGGNLHALYHLAEEAKAHELYLALEDAQSLRPDAFEAYFAWAEQAHAAGIIYCCDGTEEIESLYDRLAALVKRAPCAIEFEGKNSLRLATAQSLAAVKAGAARITASVAGICGDAPLEEVLMAAKHLWHCPFPQNKELAGDFQKIASLLGAPIARNKPLIGPEVFAHESGIHVDGIVKNPAIYEVIRPEDVGLHRKLVIGKHSGTASIRIRMLQWGFQLSNEEAACLLEAVRELAQDQKGPVSDEQLIQLFATLPKKGKSCV